MNNKVTRHTNFKHKKDQTIWRCGTRLQVWPPHATGLSVSEEAGLWVREYVKEWGKTTTVVEMPPHLKRKKRQNLVVLTLVIMFLGWGTCWYRYGVIDAKKENVKKVRMNTWYQYSPVPQLILPSRPRINRFFFYIYSIRMYVCLQALKYNLKRMNLLFIV